MPFQKGNKYGIKGRPKGSRDFAVELLDAIKRVEKKTGRKLLDYAVERCFTSDLILTNVLKKLVPDLSQTDLGEKTAATMADILAKVKGSE